MKTCSHCRQELEDNCFGSVSRRGTVKPHCWCMECYREKHRDYYHKRNRVDKTRPLTTWATIEVYEKFKELVSKRHMNVASFLRAFIEEQVANEEESRTNIS